MTSATFATIPSRFTVGSRSTLLALLGALAAACGAEPTPEAFSALTASSTTASGATGAEVHVYVNDAPRLTALTGEQVFVLEPGGQVTHRAVLRAEAADDDGDDLAFSWSSPDCPEAIITVTAEAAAPGRPADDEDGDDDGDEDDGEDEDGDEGRGPGAGGARPTMAWSSVAFSAPAELACLVEVVARDAWRGGAAPAGSGLPVARGGEAVGRLQLSRAPALPAPGQP
jgi:hypothetical protein